MDRQSRKSSERANDKYYLDEVEPERRSSYYQEKYRRHDRNSHYNHSRDRRSHYYPNREPSTSDRYYGRYHYHVRRREPEREPSPLNGSEEYTQRKIQETSEMLKRQLLSPDNCLPQKSRQKALEEKTSSIVEDTHHCSSKKYMEHAKCRKRREARALKKKSVSETSTQKPTQTYNVKEIHDQIMNHLSKLNFGRKHNLINSRCSVYDEAIKQIYKQKSLELSKALREMSHQEKPEASEIVNSIIPDFAIKFEELPVHIIRELSSTFEEIDTNIGIVDKNAPYDPPSQYMDQTDKCDSSNENYANTNFLSSQESDGRVLYLNSEDAESLVIKKENLERIKIEASDVISIEDSEDEDNLLHACRIEDITSENEFDEFQTNIERKGFSSAANNSILSSINLEADSHISSQNPLENSTYNPDHQIVELPKSNHIPEEIPQTSFNQVTPERNNVRKETNNGAIVQDNLVSSMPRIRINSNLFESPFEPLSPSDNNTDMGDIGESPQHQNDDICEMRNIQSSAAISTVQECRPSNSTVFNESQVRNNETEQEEISKINALKKETSLDNVCVKSEPTENVYISVTIQRKKTPVNVAEMTEMMFEFDREIDKLTKLRQSILTEVSKKLSQEVQVENTALLKRKLSIEHNNENSKKRKTVDSHDNPSVQTIISKELLPISHYMQQINRTSKYGFNEDNLPDVIVILKIFEPLKILLAGTRVGLLQCFDLSTYFLQKTLKLYTTKVAGLECPREILEVEPLIFAGTPQLSELTIIEYKAFKILKKVTLKDGVQVMCSCWDYLFIGGCKGYLTRYNFKTSKVEYEDSISTTSIIDLKATSEGCRRILVILTGDGTSTQIHIRDAKSGLHIRHMGEFHLSTCLLLYTVHVIVASKEGINMFNFLNGKFEAKLDTVFPITSMCNLGNFLLLVHSTGIRVYDWNHRKTVYHLKFPDVLTCVPFDYKVIAASNTNQLKTLRIIPKKIIDKLRKKSMC